MLILQCAHHSIHPYVPNSNINLFHFTESPLAIERERNLMMVVLLMMPILFSTRQVPRSHEGREGKEKIDQEVQSRHWSWLLERVLLGHLWQLPFSNYARTYWDSLAHRYSSMLSSSYFYTVFVTCTHTLTHSLSHSLTHTPTHTILQQNFSKAND